MYRPDFCTVPTLYRPGGCRIVVREFDGNPDQNPKKQLTLGFLTQAQIQEIIRSQIRFTIFVDRHLTFGSKTTF